MNGWYFKLLQAMQPSYLNAFLQHSFLSNTPFKKNIDDWIETYNMGGEL